MGLSLEDVLPSLSDAEFLAIYKAARDAHVHVQRCRFWPDCDAYDQYMLAAYRKLHPQA